MGDLVLEIGGQVDDGDGVEGAFLWANTATDAKTLGNEGQARLGGNFDAKFTTANNRARLFAFLTTLPGSTLERGANQSVWWGRHRRKRGEGQRFR